MALTAAGIVLSLLSASATLLEISDGGVVDEQEIPATVAPEVTEAAQERERTPDSGVSAVVDEATPEPHPCDGEEQISFEGFAHGAILAEQYADGGVHISAEAPNGRPDAVVVFDSGASGTADPDLEIAIGNLAVIAEDVADEDGDGLVDTPGNGYSGGTQVYTFDQNREVLYGVVLDMDTQSLKEIKAFDGGGAEITTVSIPTGNSSSVQTIEVGTRVCAA